MTLQDTQAEDGLVSAFFADPRNVGGLCVERGVSRDLFLSTTGHVWSQMHALWGESEDVNMMTVTERLRRAGELEAVGGPGRISDLFTFLPIPSNAPNCIRILHERKTVRDISLLCTDFANRVTDATEDPAGLLGDLQTAAMAIGATQRRARRTFGQHVRTYWKAIIEGSATERIISTGFRSLDEATGGFARGNLIVIAAETKRGKSALAGNISENMARAGLHVVKFSLEMTEEEEVERVIQSQARVCMLPIKRGMLVPRPILDRLTTTVEEIMDWKIDIVRDCWTMPELMSAARQIHAKAPVDCIVLDYAQLIEGDGQEERRERAVAAVTRGAKRLGTELDCAVIVLSQLNDNGKLRESRAIGQDANVILSIADMKDSDDKEIAVTGRSCPTGKVVKLRWTARHTKFEDHPDWRPEKEPFAGDDYHDR